MFGVLIAVFGMGCVVGMGDVFVRVFVMTALIMRVLFRGRRIWSSGGCFGSPSRSPCACAGQWKFTGKIRLKFARKSATLSRDHGHPQGGGG